MKIKSVADASLILVLVFGFWFFGATLAAITASNCFRDLHRHALILLEISKLFYNF